MKIKCGCIFLIWKLSALRSSSSRMRHLEFCLYDMIYLNNIVTCIFCLFCPTQKQWLQCKKNQKVFSFSFAYPNLPQKNVLSLHGAVFPPPGIQFWSYMTLVLKLLFSSEAQRSSKLQPCLDALSASVTKSSITTTLRSEKSSRIGWLWSAKLEYGHALFLTCEQM